MQQVTIINARGERIQYDITPWKGSHALSMVRRLLPLLQGAIATTGAIMARAKDTEAARQVGAILGGEDVDLDAFDTSTLVGLLGEVSEKAGGDIAGAIGWITGVLEREGDSDLFMWMLDGVVRRKLEGGDWHKFDPGKQASRDEFDAVYSGNLSELFVAAAHIIRENFGDFLRLVGNVPAPSSATASDEGASSMPKQKRELAKNRRSLAK